MFHGRFGDLQLGVVDKVPIHFLGAEPGDVSVVVFGVAGGWGAAAVDVTAYLADGRGGDPGFILDVEQLVAKSYQLLAALFDLCFQLGDVVGVAIEDFGDAFLFLVRGEEHFDLVDGLGGEVLGAVTDGGFFDAFEHRLQVVEQVIGRAAVVFPADSHHS